MGIIVVPDALIEAALARQDSLSVVLWWTPMEICYLRHADMVALLSHDRWAAKVGLVSEIRPPIFLRTLLRFLCEGLCCAS